MSLGKLAILVMPVPNVSLTGVAVALYFQPVNSLSPSKELDNPSINCVTCVTCAAIWVFMVCMAFRLVMTTSTIPGVAPEFFSISVVTLLPPRSVTCLSPPLGYYQHSQALPWNIRRWPKWSTKTKQLFNPVRR